MKKPIVIFSVLLLVLAGLFVLLVKHDPPVDNKTDELTVHCAAGLQKPVREIAKQYEEEFGTRIKLNFAGSGVLESQLKVAGGDIFIPADVSYIERTRADGLVNEAIALAELRAVIVVAKGNPKGIKSLSDLKQQGIRLCVAEPSAAVGKFVKKVLTRSGDWSGLQPQVVVTQPTVNGVVETVSTHSVDAALAWDAVALQSADVDIIRVPIFEKSPRHATVGVLKNATTPAALHFARYLSSKNKGRKVFANHRFTVPAQADSWADVPELTLFSGSMLKPAIQDRIREFEKREGCRVKTVFEGCGTLVGMMRAGSEPSAYFSCDSSFLDDVQD
ncbi:MAG: molybdate ABC transporter substrate-binding protein, partial [Akkermansiaceae bacterium]